MRCALGGIVALFVVVSLLGCGDRCEDRGQAALQAMLPQLTRAVVSNLVQEASVSIAEASAQPGSEPYYMPASQETPVARGLKPEASSEVTYSMGNSVVVHNRGPSAPFVSVRVPVHPGSGPCSWGVYMCIKPGGGFARDDTNNWVVEGRGTNATPVVKLSDEVLVYAERRSF